jgi:hypothetical protein
MDKIGDYAKVLEDIGGVNVDWCVWSRLERKARSVTDWWVDNEWDVQRRRGLKATQRKTGTTNESRRAELEAAGGGARGYSPSQLRAAGYRDEPR